MHPIELMNLDLLKNNKQLIASQCPIHVLVELS